ncbi:MAG: aspartate--tRNA ligase [Bacteroidota bacterium]
MLGTSVILCGWVHRIRDKGGLLWIDLRDRYGVTQLILAEGTTTPALIQRARALGREYVLQVTGTVVERSAKNPQMPTGDIEVQVQQLVVLSASQTPPFLIETETDGGEELRMQYRYLDLRRRPLQDNLQLRHQVMQQTRQYLNEHQFMEIETPMLIKSTPEGARDFVVPSRMHPGQCYALPQSPQLFKQLLMIAGYDRYYQLVKCFRDEDLRADRQPEFTQIDCELSFVTQEDILDLFEGLIRHLAEAILHKKIAPFKRLTYADAMRLYGTDKPDLRLEMPFMELTTSLQGKGFQAFDEAALVAGICVKGCAGYTRKQIDALTDFVRQPLIGAKGLVYIKCLEAGRFKSSVDKFFDQEALSHCAKAMQAQPGDLLLILAGAAHATRQALGALRLQLGNDLGLRKASHWAPVWVVDFPLLAWDAAAQRYQARHHPFTAPQQQDISRLDTHPEAVRAHAYDLVINGVEVGGGSIRITDQAMQKQILRLLGFSEEEARQQFGFLLEALAYGTPPHGGIAIGLDRLCALLGDEDSIRPFIAFPKNNAGRDVMLQAPAVLVAEQWQALGIQPS